MSPAPTAATIFDQVSRVARGQLAEVDVVALTEPFEERQPELAMAIYAAWLSGEPGRSSAIGWYNVAVLFERLGEVKRAKRAYRRALSVSPGLQQARFNLLRLTMTGGSPEEMMSLCKELLGGGAFWTVRDADEIARLGPLYKTAQLFLASVHEAVFRTQRAEFLYEVLMGDAGQGEFARRLAALAERRRASLRAAGTRLRCVNFEIVEGNGRPGRTLIPNFVAACLVNIDVDVISVLRLFRQGDPLKHGRLLDVVGVIELLREGATRIDIVEVWTDGIGLDLVQLEDALRRQSFDSLILRCGGGVREEHIAFLDAVTAFRKLYQIDMALKGWITAEGAEDEARWIMLLEERGWVAMVRPPAAPDVPPLPFIGRAAPNPPGPGESLSIAVDGLVEGTEDNLILRRYSEIAARLAQPTSMSA